MPLNKLFPRYVPREVKVGKKPTASKAEKPKKILFFRWVPKEHAATALASGFKAHTSAKAKNQEGLTPALWIFTLNDGSYRPSMSTGSILIVYEVDDYLADGFTSRNQIDFEDGYDLAGKHYEFGGESKHPDRTIVKKNEKGAYGVGWNVQATCAATTTTRYATKAEVAKALGKKEGEVSNDYRPGKAWT